MKKLFYMLIFLMFSVSVHAKEAYVLSLNDAISPASADYLMRGINKAVASKANVIVIELDTPGGLDTSMRQIIKAILASPVPVVTYVSPDGARAASAGTYILYASHVAAMAPATNLGAATPIDLMPSGSESPGKDNISKEKSSPSDSSRQDNPPVSADAKSRKAVHDAAAYIRSLAELRGRNAEWADQAVREAVSLSATAALELNVIDLIAPDIQNLLKQIHGRKVKVLNQELVLDTNESAIVKINSDWRMHLLSIISNPGLAYILLMIGFYGLIYEFSNPGMLFPGVIGSICLLLALFALQLMPINYVGLALILLGIMMMFAEIFIPSFGALGLGGLVAFIFGSIMLIDTDIPGYGISWLLIAPVAATTLAFSLLAATLALRARNRPIVTGSEEMIGAEGQVVDIKNHAVWARIHGELWRVNCPLPLKKNHLVRVRSRNGLELTVEPVNEIKEKRHA
jgi:membrane-bound serine protease (ClpP class)